MPRHPDDPVHDENTGFLQRWSERKANAAAEAEPVAPEVPVNAETDGAAPSNAEPGTDETTADAPPAVTEADLENLTYDSDYTKFMGEQVPEALRRRALRQLWRSDPILANVDGLCDYDDDFTDAALAVKVLKTAHRIGQGYLTDEEVAANQALGNPAPEAQEAEASPNAEPVEDDAEDIADFDDDVTDDESETIAAASDEDEIDELPTEPSKQS